MAAREQVKQLQAELEEAYDRIAELEVASGLDEFRKRAEAAESKNIRLEEENAQLTRDNERLRDQLDALSEQVSQLDRELREERQARTDATEALARMKTNFERAEDQLARERQRASDAAAAGARAVKDRQVHSVELEKYASENAELREEIRVLNEDLLAYREAVAELKGDLEDAAEDKLAADQALREAQAEIAALRAELQESQSAIQRSSTALEERDEDIRELRRELETSASRAAADIRSVKDKLSVAERAVTSAHAELKAVKDSSRVRELEDEVVKAHNSVEAIRHELSSVSAQRDELSGLLDAHNAQLEACMAEIKALQEDRDAAVQEALAKEREHGETAGQARQQTVAAATMAVREERGRAVEIATQKADVERDLEEARARLVMYERGYGLEDAVREQERLRDAIRRRDADIARLTRAAGAQLDAYDIAVEIANRLADKAGMAAGTDVFKLYPELQLRQGIDSTVERLKAVNAELQRQNDALEEQRLKLLRQLRVHAENMGDKALKYYGLTAEQLMLVNEFAENLRDGKVELPVHDRTVEVQAELTKVRAQLEALTRELDDARAGVTAAAFAAAAQTKAAAPAPAPAPAAAKPPTPVQSPVPTAAAAAPAVPTTVELTLPPGLAASLDTLAEENRKLRTQMEALVAGQADKAKRAGAVRSASRAAMPVIEPTGDGPVDDALSILKIKLEADDVLDPEEMVQLARVIGRLVDRARLAVERGGSEHEAMLTLQGKAEGLQSKADAAERLLATVQEEVRILRVENEELENEQLAHLVALRKQIQDAHDVAVAAAAAQPAADGDGTAPRPAADPAASAALQASMKGAMAFLEGAAKRAAIKASEASAARQALVKQHLEEKTALDKAISDLKAKVAQAGRQAGEQSASLSQAQADARTAFKDLKDTAQRLSAVSTQAQVAQTTVDVMVPQLADAQKQLASARAQVESLKQENHELERQQLEQLAVLKKQLAAVQSHIEGSMAHAQTAVQKAMAQQLAETIRRQVEATTAQLASLQAKADERAALVSTDREQALAHSIEEKAAAEKAIALLTSERDSALAQVTSLRTQVVEAHRLLANARGEVSQLMKDNAELEQQQLEQLTALRQQLADTHASLSASFSSSPAGLLSSVSELERPTAQAIADIVARMEARTAAEAKTAADTEARHTAEKAEAHKAVETARAELASVKTAAASEASQLRVQLDLLRAQAAESQRELTAAKGQVTSLKEAGQADKELLAALESIKDQLVAGQAAVASASTTAAAAAQPPEITVTGGDGSASTSAPSSSALSDATLASFTAAVTSATSQLTALQARLEGRAGAQADLEKATATAAFERGEAERQIAGLRAQLSEAKASSAAEVEFLKGQLDRSAKELASVQAALKDATATNARLRTDVLGLEKGVADQLTAIVAKLDSLRAAMEAMASGSTSGASSSEAADAAARNMAGHLHALQGTLQAITSKQEARVVDAQSQAAAHSASAAEREASTRALAVYREQLASAQDRLSAAQEWTSKVETDLRAAHAELAEVKGKLAKAGTAVAAVTSAAGLVGPAAGGDTTLIDDLGEPKGIQGPRTAAGQAKLKLLRRSEPDGAPVEPEEWAAEVTDARAALVEALEELAVREDETSRFEALVRDYAGKAGGMMAQQTALYRAYIAEKASWEAALSQARDREAEALSRAEALASKAKRLDEVTAVLEAGSGKMVPADVDSAEVLAYVTSTASAAAPGLATGEAEARREDAVRKLRDYVKALARKLAALELAQPMLARKYNLVKAEAAAARAGQRSAELSAVEMESHLRSRVLYLELWKKGAESRLARLSDVASTWVPGAEHERAVAALASLQAQHAELLSSEGALRVQYTELRGLPARVASLEASARMAAVELEQTRGSLDVARDEAAAARAALTAAVVASGGMPSSADPLSDPAAGVLSSASRPELIAAVTKQRAQLGELEVQLAGLSKKNGLLRGRVAELEGATEALHRRAVDAEDTSTAARAALARSEAAKSEAFLRAGLSADGSPSSANGGAGADSPAVSELKSRVKALEDERDELSRELHKARGVADIASDQARAVEGLIKDRELEVEELREAVRRLSARSDDDAIIGNLQQQLLALKSAYHTFLRKHEATKGALSRHRVAVAALELAVDQRAGEVLALQEDSRVRTLALQKLLDNVRSQLRALEGANTTLAQAASFAETVRRLSSAVDRQAQELDDAVRARHVAEEAAEARTAEVESLLHTVEDLKLAASAAASSAAGRGAGAEARDVARRLVELNDSLKHAQLAALRQRRELALMRDEARIAKRRLEQYEGHVRMLEERLVAADTDMRRKDEEHRRQLKLAVSQAVAEAGDAAAIVAANAAKNSAASTPTSAAGSTAKPTVATGAGTGVSSSETAEEIAVKLQQLEAALSEERRNGRDLRERARAAVERSRLRGRRVAFLEGQLAANGVDVRGYRDGYGEEDSALGAIIGGPEDDDDDDPSGGRGDENAQPGAGGAAAKTAGRTKGSTRPVVATAAADAMVNEVRGAYEDELKRLQKAAAATTSSLKELLAKKNSLIAEYQAKLEGVRKEVEMDKMSQARERDKAVQAAYAENAATIDKLRASLKALQASQSHGPSMATTAALEQLHERAEGLERAISDRDRRIAELEVDKRGLAGRLAMAMAAPPMPAPAPAPVYAPHTPRAPPMPVAPPTPVPTPTPVAAPPPPAPAPIPQSVAVAIGELEAARKRAEDAERKLRDELAVRDRKLKALQASFTALKEEFVRAEEEHAAALVHAQAAAAAAQARAGRASVPIGVNTIPAKPVYIVRAESPAPTAGSLTVGASSPAHGSATNSTSTKGATDSKTPEAEDGHGASAGAANKAGDASGKGDDFASLRDAALRDKVGALVEQVGRMGRDVKTLKGALTAAEAEKERLASELDKARQAHATLRASVGGPEGGLMRLKADNDKLKRELETVKGSMAGKLAEAQAARAAAEAALAHAPHGHHNTSGMGLRASVDGEDTAALQRKIKVLEAQVAALRSAQAENSMSSHGSPPVSNSFDGRGQGGMGLSSASGMPRVGAVAPPPAPGTAGQQQANAMAVADARAAWENDRKLRKRVEGLQVKLSERIKEVEGLRSGEEALQTALAKVKAERDTLDKRMAAMIKKQAQLDAATTSALAHLEPVADLKARLFSLQEDMAVLRKTVEHDMSVKVKRAEADAQEARMQAEGAAADAAEARQRLVQLQGLDGSMSSRKADTAAAEAELRTRLADARRTIANLEGSILSKDATLLEARLEAEAARQAEDRLRARLAEVQAFTAIARQAGAKGEAVLGKVNGPQGAAQPTRREQELEELTVAMKRVTDNQRSEIDRLRKQLVAMGNARDSALAAAASAANASAQAAAARELVEREKDGGLGSDRSKNLEHLELATKSAEEAQELLRQLRASRAEVARLKDKVTALEAPLPGDTKGGDGARRQAVLAESELKNMRAKYAALERSQSALAAEVAALRDREKAAQARAAAMEKRLKDTGNASFVPPPLPAAEPSVSFVNTSAASGLPGGTGPADAVAAASAAAVMAPGAVVPSTGTTTSASASPDVASRLAVLEAENSALKREASELRTELAAFDLDFFEEVEDLKYKYAEAAKKCRAFDEYVRLYPPVMGAPQGLVPMVLSGTGLGSAASSQPVTALPTPAGSQKPSPTAGTAAQ